MKEPQRGDGHRNQRKGITGQSMVLHQEELQEILACDWISRRGFLALGCMTLASWSFPGRAAAVRGTPPKTLAFYNTHTGESLETCYWRDGGYRPGALADIDVILRDHRSGEVKPIDRGLLDLLFDLKTSAGTTGPFHVISGYRSAVTNATLRKRSRGVASRSLHLVGKAVDIRIPGLKTKALRDAALKLRAGGVGYYPGPAFVHVDVGRVRRWGG